MSTKQFCDDTCKKVVTRNMVTDPLVVKWGNFKAVVTVTSTQPDPALCSDCLITALTAKPKRAYVRKQKAIGGGTAGQGEGGAAIQTKGESIHVQKGALATSTEKGKPDISTFAIKTGMKGEWNKMSMAGVETQSFNLKDGANYLLATLGLDQAYVEASPDSEGRRNLLDILNAGKQ